MALKKDFLKDKLRKYLLCYAGQIRNSLPNLFGKYFCIILYREQ